MEQLTRKSDMNDTTPGLKPLSEYRFNMLADAAMDVLVQCTPGACKVWLVMCKARRWGSDRVQHSVSALAAAAGMARRTVLRAVKELREAGLLRFEAQRNRTTDYEVVGVLPRGGRPDVGSERDVRVRRALQSLLPPVDDAVYNAVDNVPSGVPEPEPSLGLQVQKLHRNSAPGVQKLHLIPRELPSKRTEVGFCSSNPLPARERDVAETDLLPDPLAEWRRRRIEHGRLIAAERTEDVAGALDAEDSVAGVREEVRRRRLAGDSTGEILSGFLVPADALEAVYSPEDVPGALGADWRPFAADRAPSAEFSAMLGAPAGSVYVRSVWDRVLQAAVWRELTPRVVRAAVQHVGPADVATTDAMTVEIWSQIKAQRMSVRSAINEATGAPVEEAGTR